MCLFSLYSWLRQVHWGISWARGWSCLPHFPKEVPGRACSPVLEPWPQRPSQWKRTNSSSIAVLEGEKSFFCLLYFNSLCFPNRFAVHKRMFISDAVQSRSSTAAVWSRREWLILQKEMVKFAKLQIPPELFRPDWPNMRGICVTHVKGIPSWLRQCKMLFFHQ